VAQAGGVRLREVCAYQYETVSCGTTLYYAASPGETNDVMVTDDDGGVTVHDATASLQADPTLSYEGSLPRPAVTGGCAQIDAHTARCALSGMVVIGNFVGDLGDGNDRLVMGHQALTVRPLPATINGGPGDDVILDPGGSLDTIDGGPGNDFIQGPDGRGILIGGPGSDTLIGGRGNDTLIGDGTGGPPAADFMDGGGGTNTVSYGDRTTPVHVDLRDPGPHQGPVGEGDTIRNVQNVVGGAARDVLIGNDDPNMLAGCSDVAFVLGAPKGAGCHAGDVIYGMGGNDRLNGSDGNDVLDGGSGNDEIEAGGGRDVIRGGPGNDSIDLGPLDLTAHPQSGSVSCGSGQDTVNIQDNTASAPVSADCERVAFSDIYVRMLPTGGPRRLVIEVRRAPSDSISCRVMAQALARRRGRPISPLVTAHLTGHPHRIVLKLRTPLSRLATVRLASFSSTGDPCRTYDANYGPPSVTLQFLR